MKKIIITIMAMISIVAFAQGKQKDGVIYDAVITRVIDGVCWVMLFLMVRV